MFGETITIEGVDAQLLSKYLLFNHLFRSFALPILFKGRKKTLEPTDLYQALKDHKAESLGDIFFGTWQAEVNSCRNNPKKEPSIIKVILKVFGWQLFMSGVVIGVLELGTR